MRIKDESEDSDAVAPEDDEETIDTLEFEAPVDTPLESVKRVLREHVGERCGLEDIYQDNSMEHVIQTVSDFGAVLQFGRLRVGYIDRDQQHDMILLPGEPATIVVVNPKCPRDKIIQVLNDNL
jgi:hypothetical protein